MMVDIMRLLFCIMLCMFSDDIAKEGTILIDVFVGK
jgi:hypothetical protein